MIAPALPAAPAPAPMRAIDWLWRIRGQLPLAPGLGPDAAFARLAPLFDTEGTTLQRHAETLSFRKVHPRAQDPMAVFDAGHLTVHNAQLAYDLNSRALLACCGAPLLFLALAGLLASARTPGEVFAGIFVALYIGGRVLEPWLVKRRFAAALDA